MFLKGLRFFVTFVAGLVAVAVLLVILFIALFLIEDWRMKHQVASIKTWIAAELPPGSTVPDTMRIVMSHGVKKENIHYDDRQRRIGAYYPHNNRWYEPLDANIGMQFYFNGNGHLERSSVELAYTFL
jgi:hypothetical protein